MEHRSSDLTKTWDEIRFIGGKIQIIVSKQIYAYSLPYNRTEVGQLFGLISPLLVSWYLERNNVMQHEYANSTSRKYSYA